MAKRSFQVASGDFVGLAGLADLRKDLRQLDKEAPKMLREELKAVVMAVAKKAAQDVPVRSGKAKRSVKGFTSGNWAGIKGGTKKGVPYYGWLDFGGVLKATGGRRNTQTQHEAKEGGRYIYPTIAKESKTIQNRLYAAIDKALERADFE